MNGRVSSRRFIDAATARGLGPFTGVPCSFLRPFIDYVIDRDDLEYVAATNEGEALAFAAGMQLAGRLPVVMLQNSGLGNLINPLASLNHVFRIPTLIIVTLRGEPGLNDEPQHELMGRITGEMFTLLGVPHAPFPVSDEAIEPALDAALGEMGRTGRAYAFILRKNVVDEYAPRARLAREPRPPGRHVSATNAGEPLSRRAAVALVATHTGDALIVATTGKTGRELFEHRDAPSHFYVVGSMGCASSVALGVAHASHEPVAVLDGDGAALMRLEALATIGHLAPQRFVHVILDNGAYESTGGQETIAHSVHFPAIAAACGYATACTASGVDALAVALDHAVAAPGPHLIHTRVGIDTAAGLGRPSIAPPEVATRFRAEIARRIAAR